MHITKLYVCHNITVPIQYLNSILSMSNYGHYHPLFGLFFRISLPNTKFGVGFHRWYNVLHLFQLRPLTNGKITGSVTVGITPKKTKSCDTAGLHSGKHDCICPFYLSYSSAQDLSLFADEVICLSIVPQCGGQTTSMSKQRNEKCV